VSEPTPPPREPGDGKEKPSTVRIAIWVGVAAVALYFIGSGLYGVLTSGH
jgi:hypothetical protein